MNGSASRTPTLEALLVLIILVAAGWLRLARLGWAPLTDSEAAQALAAARDTTYGSAFWADRTPPTDPLYSVLTWLGFQATGSSDAGARLVPAIAGLALVLVPLLLGGVLGHGTALVASLMLAISPALVTTSRTAGGTALAALGLTLAVVLVLRGDGEPAPSPRRLACAAVAFGLALASGAPVWNGLLGMGIGAGVAAVLTRMGRAQLAWVHWRSLRDLFRRPWLVLLTMLAAASAIGFYLTGVPGLFEGLGAWIRGWGSAESMKAGTVFAALLVYEPLAVILGIIGVVRALRRKVWPLLWAATWALGASVVMLIYPARRAEDMIWLIVPLVFLAAPVLGGLIDRLVEGRAAITVVALASLLVVLLGITAEKVAAFVGGFSPSLNTDPSVNLGLGLAALALALLIVVLFGLGWSWSLAAEAGGIAGSLALLAIATSGLWRLNFEASATSGRELWRPEAGGPEVRRMLDTLRGVSQADTGQTDGLSIYVDGEPTSGLAWALRSFRAASAGGGGAQQAPAIEMVRESGQAPRLDAQYLGQTINVSERWGWDGVLPPDFLGWWVARRSPTASDQWLLLVRADIGSFGVMPAEQAPTPGG